MCQQSKSYYHYLLNCQEGVLVQVTLGSAKFSDCRNFGICRMNTIPGIDISGCRNCLYAYVRIDQPTGRLLLHFISSALDKETQHRFFSRQAFRMDEDFVLPGTITNQLKYSGNSVVIERGNYPVLHDGQFYTLSFRISEAGMPFKVLPESAAEN